MLTIGGDPEFFLKRNGHYVSAHDMGCGTKKEPMVTKRGALQVDGVALEVNINPAGSRSDFIKNTFGVMDDLREYLNSKGKGYELIAQPSVWFGKQKLENLPEEAKALGCEPDFNAYTGVENPRPDQSSEYRTGSGHITLGWGQVTHPRSLVHMKNCCILAKELDYYVGLPSLRWDADATRRSLYGRAGAFRPTKFGIEYRVLSNKWLTSPSLAGFVYDQAVKAFNNWRENTLLDKTYVGLAQDIINNNKTTWAGTYSELSRKVYE